MSFFSITWLTAYTHCQWQDNNILVKLCIKRAIIPTCLSGHVDVRTLELNLKVGILTSQSLFHFESSELEYRSNTARTCHCIFTYLAWQWTEMQLKVIYIKWFTYCTNMSKKKKRMCWLTFNLAKVIIMKTVKWQCCCMGRFIVSISIRTHLKAWFSVFRSKARLFPKAASL